MKISTKGRYGLRTLMDIAIHQAQGPVNLNDIAERQGISAKYLWQIVSLLKTAGLVRGMRGPKGGYILLRDPASITLLDVIQILEGPVSLVECVDDPQYCTRTEKCVAHSVWEEVSHAVRDGLRKITLAEILRRHVGAGGSGHYVI
ncbi:MAG: Rrf2 family transcriptional regulator [Kiritimatiellia bacterium]